MDYMDKQLLTVQEAAEIFGVNYQTMCRWLRQGLIKGKKVGKLWRIHRDNLNKYLGQQKTGG